MPPSGNCVSDNQEYLKAFALFMAGACYNDREICYCTCVHVCIL